MAALDMYQRSHKMNKPFELVSACQILSKCPKFMVEAAAASDKLTGNRDRGDGDVVGADVSGVDSDAEDITVPTRGMKAAKRAQVEQRTSDRKAAAGERMAQAAIHRTEALQVQVVQTLFTATAVDDDHVEILQIQRVLMLRTMRQKMTELNKAVAKRIRRMCSQDRIYRSLLCARSQTANSKHAAVKRARFFYRIH